MENDVNSKEILCNKISVNPRKGFLQSLDRGMNKIKKTNIFSNPTSLKLSFAPGHGMFHGTFWDTLMYSVHSTQHNNDMIDRYDVNGADFGHILKMYEKLKNQFWSTVIVIERGIDWKCEAKAKGLLLNKKNVDICNYLKQFELHCNMRKFSLLVQVLLLIE